MSRHLPHNSKHSVLVAAVVNKPVFAAALETRRARPFPFFTYLIALSLHSVKNPALLPAANSLIVFIHGSFLP